MSTEKLTGFAALEAVSIEIDDLAHALDLITLAAEPMVDDARFSAIRCTSKMISDRLAAAYFRLSELSQRWEAEASR